MTIYPNRNNIPVIPASILNSNEKVLFYNEDDGCIYVLNLDNIKIKKDDKWKDVFTKMEVTQ